MQRGKKSLLQDIAMAKMIICEPEQYHSFVKSAMQNEVTNLKGLGNYLRAKIITVEMHRLDDLHAHKHKHAA